MLSEFMCTHMRGVNIWLKLTAFICQISQRKAVVIRSDLINNLWWKCLIMKGMNSHMTRFRYSPNNTSVGGISIQLFLRAPKKFLNPDKLTERIFLEPSLDICNRFCKLFNWFIAFIIWLSPWFHVLWFSSASYQMFILSTYVLHYIFK